MQSMRVCWKVHMFVCVCLCASSPTWLLSIQPSQHPASQASSSPPPSLFTLSRQQSLFRLPLHPSFLPSAHPPWKPLPASWLFIASASVRSHAMCFTLDSNFAKDSSAGTEGMQQA